uniref:Putative secreted protein n=1 Tax=Ixodes ricinus TaxID=34613 RepID=A0A6B0U2T7_IXORI
MDGLLDSRLVLAALVVTVGDPECCEAEGVQFGADARVPFGTSFQEESRRTIEFHQRIPRTPDDLGYTEQRRVAGS